jgi:hypothetical protein
MKPGIYYNMPDAEYHATPDLSASGIKLLLDRTPLHYWDRYLNPDRPQRDATTFQVIGKAWHASIFEPARFADTFAAEPDWPKQSNTWKLLVEFLAGPSEFGLKYTAIPDGIGKTSKDAKALLADLAEMGQIGIEESVLSSVTVTGQPLIGKELLPADRLADVIKMAASARSYPPAAEWLRPTHKGVGESSIFWTDPETGVHCKIRPDYMIPPCDAHPLGLIIDGKSAEDACAEGFGRAIWSYGYLIQAAHYTDGFQRYFGTDAPPPFYWLVQEKESPFATVAYSCSDAQREYGMRLVMDARQMYAECNATGVWPGYTTEVADIEMPGYAQKQIDGDSEEIEVTFLTEDK